jgi:hypothetical protein
MMKSDEGSPHASSGAHLVQLFDDTDSRASAVAGFVLDGLFKGESVLIVSTAPQWDAVASRLRAGGLALNESLALGEIVWREAGVVLRSFMTPGRSPNPALFEETVGSLVHNLAARGRGLRIYGEMVDLLAADGDYRGGLELEELWNGLRTRETFMLFCGYTAGHFGDPRNGEALQAICRSHTHVCSNSGDVLGTFLLQTYGTSPAGDRQPPLITPGRTQDE